MFQAKDRIFYGWVIVGAIIANSFIMMGVNSSFGVFFRSLEDAFGLSRAATSAILSGRMVFGGVFAFLGGWAIDRYGPRLVFSIMGFFIGVSLILTGQATAAWQLFITYSLLLAIGGGAAYVVATSTVLRWFDRKRGLALGIAGSGSGLGIASVAPLAAFLIDSFSWRSALMILGGIAWLVVLPVSQLLKRDPYHIGALPDGTAAGYGTYEVEQGGGTAPKVSLLRTFLTWNFWSFLFAWLLMAFSGFFVMTHIVPHAMDIGFSAVESATILSLSGVAMTAGRFAAGVITDRLSARAVAIGCSLLQALAMLWLVWAEELGMLYLFGLVNGFTVGGFGTSITVLIGRSFGVSHIGQILGALEIGIFVGAALGPLLGGLIFDINHSYTLAFLIMAGTVLSRVLLVVFIKEEASVTSGK